MSEEEAKGTGGGLTSQSLSPAPLAATGGVEIRASSDADAASDADAGAGAGAGAGAPTSADNEEKESTSTSSSGMTPEERLAWLRERGVVIETAEDRRRRQIRDIMNEATQEQEEEEDLKSSNEPCGSFAYVLVPADESKPMRELALARPTPGVAGGAATTAEAAAAARRDLLPEHLASYFATKSCGDVDISFLRERLDSAAGDGGGVTLLGTDGVPTRVSDESLRHVAATQSSVEVFPLVRPCPSNDQRGVNVYLDEIGMLRRLPLNRRAAALAERVGFNPPPRFYGDVFLGRVRRAYPNAETGGGEINEDFRLGDDTNPHASWLRTAMNENLDHQRRMNEMTGRTGELMKPADGTDGVAKQEDGGSYSWTQDEEEIELTVPLSYDVGEVGVTTKNVAVKFKPRNIFVTVRGIVLLSLDLFAPVDVDGCTWTLDKGGEGGDDARVVLTCEKTEAAMWPRVGR